MVNGVTFGSVREGHNWVSAYLDEVWFGFKAGERLAVEHCPKCDWHNDLPHAPDTCQQCGWSPDPETAKDKPKLKDVVEQTIETKLPPHVGEIPVSPAALNLAMSVLHLAARACRGTNQAKNVEFPCCIGAENFTIRVTFE